MNLSTCGQVWRPDLQDQSRPTTPPWGSMATPFIDKVSTLEIILKKGLNVEPLSPRP